MIGIRSTRLKENLDANCDGDNYRVTVLYHCGDKILCTTGKVLALFDDVLVVKGFNPTKQEKLAGDGHDGGGDCKDCNSLELLIFIDLDDVCAVFAGLPPCREACVPECCECNGHGHRVEGGMI